MHAIRAAGARLDPSAIKRRRARVIVASACALVAGAARTLAVAPTPTQAPVPRFTADLGTALIRGRVFDSSHGSNAGIAGARVDYDHIARVGPGAHGSLVTDAAGAFSFTLALHDTDLVVIRADAVDQGFFPASTRSSGAELWFASAPIEIGLDPLERVDTAISGLVYDASIGPDAPLEGAEVGYEYGSAFFPASSGSMRTGLDGRYRFVLALAPEHGAESITLTVEKEGFTGGSAYLSSAPWTSTAVNFPLIPVGGSVRVEPAHATVACSGTFDVTITNDAPSEEMLVITGIDLHHGYSQGDYGTGFTWDLAHIRFPVYLASGEQLVLPLSFQGGTGDFPSRLHLAVRSGARVGDNTALYRGRVDGCPPTGGSCNGDCNGDGRVTIDELVVGTRIALDAAAATACNAMDANADAIVEIGELTAAVGNALWGCRGATPTPTP